MASEQPAVYESPFTKDAILHLTDYLKDAIAAYAKEHGNSDGKVDFFVLLGGLGQTAFDMTFSTLPLEKEQRESALKETKTIVDGLLAKLDGLRAEFKTRGTCDMLAAAQLLATLAEVFCKRRDQAILRTVSDLQQNTESKTQ